MHQLLFRPALLYFRRNRIYMLFLLMLFPSFLYSQVKDEVLLRIDDLRIEEDVVSLSFQIFNRGKEDMNFFKPNLESVCTGIVGVYALDSQGNKFEVDPCEGNRLDLDSINLTYRNVVNLASDERFLKVFKFNVQDFSPYLEAGRYEVYIALNYSFGNFKGDVRNVYEGDLISPEHVFEY